MRQPFVLTLYDDADNIIAIGIPSPCIPAVGTQLIVSQLAAGEFCWQVEAVQMHFPDPASRAALQGEPYMAGLRCKPGTGVHDE